ncbi:MAG: carbohydrate binding domain-containing protein [Sedimentisphaerales bacterium]|nr:carbohydrate binding domain-containing protein [Sedimentisphaerales bacterium]
MSSKGICKSLFLVLFFSMVSSSCGDTNILTNPGFENGTDGWAGRVCGLEAAKSPVRSGSGSGKAVGRTANWQGVRQSVFDKMVNGKTYKLSGWVRLENAASAPVALSVEQQDGKGTNYYNVATATATDSNWVLLSGNFTLNVDGELSVLDVYFEGPPADVNFFVDDANAYGPEGAAVKAAVIEPNATGEIDTGTRLQKIEGFGAGGAHYTKEFVNHKKKDELYKLLFKELGLDIFRIRNNYDMEPKSFEETVEVVKGAQAALGRDLNIMISSWSPPAKLKSNGSTVRGTLVKIDGKYAYAEFAKWWAESIAAYAKAGVQIDYINIQNEPDYEAPWDSCRFSPAEDANMAGYDAAFEAVWQKLNDETELEMPKMLAPETYSLNTAIDYIDKLDDLSHVYGYAHHLYGCSGCAEAPDRYVPEMERLKTKYGSKPLMQTEFQHEPNTWAGAMNMAVLIHNSMTVENAAAYLYWDLFWGPTSGMVSLNLNDLNFYNIKPVYYAFKQYSAFIDSNWHRIEAATDNPALRISAYISPDNQKLTAVIINTAPATDITLNLSLKGAAISKGEVYRSSEKEKCVDVGSFKTGEPLKLPANSITTLAFSAGDKDYDETNTNILINPGFEKGTDGWGGRGCPIEAVSTPVRSGSGSVKASGRNAAWQGVRQSVFDTMTDGKTYQISGWVRLDNAPSGQLLLSVEQQDDSGTHYHNVATVTAADSNWVLLSGNFTLDVNGALTVLDVYFDGAAPGVNFYVDDVNVYGPKPIDKSVAIKPTAAGGIDVNKRCQKIEGLGASGGFRTMEFVENKHKAELYDLLFKELGIDIFRIRNTYDINKPDFDSTVEIANGGKNALGGNLKIMISSWTPPAKLKSNGSVIGGTLAKKNGKFAYDEFAQWWYDSLNAYDKAGVKADYITIQNEPDWEAPYDSCVFNPTEDANRAGYDAALEAVWQKLNTEMGPAMPKLLDPETMGFSHVESYIERLNSSLVYGYAHHLYDCSGCAENPDRYIPKMVRFKKFNEQHGNKPLFQTEFEDEPMTWTGAMNTAVLVHNSLTVEEVASYLYWDLFWDPNSGLVSINDPNTYTIRPAYYAFKQFSAFTGSDWQRVEAATDNPGLRISAYISPDNKKLTAVIINTTPDIDISLTFSLKGSAISHGEIYRSSEKENCVNIGSFKAGEPLKLPANSITTVVLSASE